MQRVNSIQRFYSRGTIIFLLPALTLFGLFVAFPLLYGLSLSFHTWGGFKEPWEWIGLGNYLKILTDKVFQKSFINNLVFSFFALFVRTAVGLLIALLLDREFKFSRVFKTIFFTPFIVSLVVTALVWFRIYDPNLGFLNKFIQLFNPDFSHAWLGETSTALISVSIIWIWKTFGWPMLIFLAGLKGISPELRESALVDGANRQQITGYIIIPLLRPIIALVLVLTTIQSFKIFALVYATTRGGPLYATEVPVTYIYKAAFEYYEFGRASAGAWILVILLIVFSLMRKRIAGKEL